MGAQDRQQPQSKPDGSDETEVSGRSVQEPRSESENATETEVSVARHLLDERLGAIAGRRKGLLTIADLRGAGMTDAGVWRRVKAGRLFTVHRGVYALLPRDQLPPRALDLAAVLALGDGARLSSHSCAAVWKFRPECDDPRHVETPAHGRRSRPGIVVREGADRREWAIREDIPIMSAAHTLLEIAHDLTQHELEQAVRKAQVLRCVTVPQLRDILDRHPRHAGWHKLAAAIDYTDRRESPLEDRAWEFFIEAGLPLPESNVKVGNRRVDYFWRDRQLIVECDSREHHEDTESFEEDREHLADGCRTVRITNRKLKRGRTKLAVQLARLLF